MRTLASVLMPAALLAQVDVPYERIRDANSEPGNWLTYSRDYSGLWLRTRYLLTLVSPMSMPSLSNSPWMRGAPQKGIVATHLRNQFPSFLGDGRSSKFVRGRPSRSRTASGGWDLEVPIET